MKNLRGTLYIIKHLKYNSQEWKNILKHIVYLVNVNMNLR